MEKLLDKIKNSTKKCFVENSKIKDDQLLISDIYYCQLKP